MKYLKNYKILKLLNFEYMILIYILSMYQSIRSCFHNILGFLFQDKFPKVLLYFTKYHMNDNYSINIEYNPNFDKYIFIRKYL